MKDPIILRDVMNTKSMFKCRHSINASNINSLKNYYAIESRIYNSIFDESENKYKKGPLWMSNIMVFDFDFDEKHFPNISDYELELNKSLSKLKSILGNPKFIIYNKKIEDIKSNLSQDKIDFYFKNIDKNGNEYYNFPKQYGCQVVYELKYTIKSQFPEIINLYNKLRLYITEKTNADLNFKGHMFKNYYNHDIFDIIQNDDFNEIDIFSKSLEISLTGYDENKINRIKELKDFEKLDDNKKLPNNFKKLNNKLFHYYNNLNTWKINNNNVDYNIEFIKKDSRNETLFEYFKIISYEDLLNIQYCDLKDLNIFDHCIIEDDLSEIEFNSTKESVLLYREKNGLYDSSYNISNEDLRVFKWIFNDIDLNFIENNINKFNLALNNYKTNNKIFINYNDYLIPIYLFKNKTKNNTGKYVKIKKSSVILANFLLTADPIFILNNIKSIFTPNTVSFLNKELFNDDFELYEMYYIIKNAIYYIHFKLYNDIKNFNKKSKINENKINNSYIKINKNNKNKLIKIYGLNYRGNIKGFSKFYYKLKKDNLLKDNGLNKPISFYQQLFHIRNIQASRLCKNIKKYFLIEFKLKKVNKYKNIDKKLCNKISLQNPSVNIFIIYIFIIYYLSVIFYINNYIFKILLIKHINILFNIIDNTTNNITDIFYYIYFKIYLVKERNV